MLVGAALAAAGAGYQNLFRNPIVSPDILGVSAGTGFGASLAVMLNIGAFGIQASAFVAGLIAVTLCFAIGQAINRAVRSVFRRNTGAHRRQDRHAARG
jgi:iron complex transport system permease protein